MRAVGLAVAALSVAAVLLGLGCLKMNVDIKVYENGSATGSFSIAIPEAFWNMSQSMNMSAGNETGIGGFNMNLSMGLGSNVTSIRHEGGYVYIESAETPIPPENFSITIEKQGGYTYYTLYANMSQGEDMAAGQEEVNLSEPFTQMMLQQMRIQFKVTMPGKIVESNGNYTGSTATWSYSGLQIGDVGAVYARSRLSVPELMLVPAVLLAVAIVRRRRTISG